MPEFVIFLRPRAVPIPPPTIREHCARLAALGVRLIAGGPFADAEGGGMMVATFDSIDAARDFAATDPFVRDGHETFEVRPWHWSRPQNGHLGVLPPSPGAAPGFLETLKLRATTRTFAGRPVDDALVRELIEAALAAPSEFNLQPWRPVVCHRAEDRRRLQACCFDQPQVGAAGVAAVCAVDAAVFIDEAPRAADEFIAAGRWPASAREERIRFIRGCYEDPRDAAIRNGVLFGHQLLLAGVACGLAGFWLGGFDAAAVRREFGMAETDVIAGVVGLGWPEEAGRPMPRQPAERTVGWGDRPTSGRGPAGRR